MLYSYSKVAIIVSFVLYYLYPHYIVYTGALRLYYGTYRSLISDTYTDGFLKVICRTSVIPPTNVTWMREGELVNTDGTDFEQSQIITSRYQVYYDNILTVKNASFALGRQNYTCIVENCHENTSIIENITTDISEGIVFTCGLIMFPSLLMHFAPRNLGHVSMGYH